MIGIYCQLWIIKYFYIIWWVFFRSCGISLKNSPGILIALVPHRILYITMANFLRVQVLSFIVRDQTFGKDLKLRTKIINISDSIAGQPLPSDAMFDEDRGASCHRSANRIKSLFPIDMFDDPNGARADIARDWDFLEPAEFGAAHGGHRHTLQIELY